MHHIYHTEGIILDSRNYGETGKYYSIFTRDLGMVYASAQGVRKMSSKLRFVLQDFSYIKIDLVKGRDFWRVTSASKTGQLEKISDENNLEISANISMLLKRLLAGEEPNEILFGELLNGFSALESSKSFEESRNIEIILVLRILSRLGYIGDGQISGHFINSPLEKELVFEISKSKAKILSEINKALKETHL